MKKVIKQHRLSKDLLELIEQFEWFFETHYTESGVEYKETDAIDNRAATIEMVRDYKEIVISIYPLFFKQSKQKQKEILLHEFTHTLILPLQIAAESAIEGAFVNEAMLKSALEQSTSAVQMRLASLLEGNSRFMVEAYKKIK